MGIYNLGGGGGAPELQAKEATPLITNAQQIILPDEGYDGLSKVTVNPMPTGVLKTPTVNSIGYVSSGVQTAGYFDTSATSGLQLSTQAAKTITPTTYSQTAVASGKYTTGAVTVAGDANLVSSNIVAGKSIFGVSGTAQVAKFYVGVQGPSYNFDGDIWVSSTLPSHHINKVLGFSVVSSDRSSTHNTVSFSSIIASDEDGLIINPENNKKQTISYKGGTILCSYYIAGSSSTTYKSPLLYLSSVDGYLSYLIYSGNADYISSATGNTIRFWYV